MLIFLKIEDGCKRKHHFPHHPTPPSEKSDTLPQTLYKIFFHFRKKTPGIPLLEFQVFFLCRVLFKQSSIQLVGSFLLDFFQHMTVNVHGDLIAGMSQRSCATLGEIPSESMIVALICRRS